MTAPSPLLDLIRLAQEPSSARRRELLRKVTDLFLADAHPASEAQAFDGVMCSLAQDLELDVRTELAERFAHASEAPATLAAQLARDCIQVAMPILSNARLLSEADLLDVARSQGQSHLRLVSSRPGLSEAVSDVIVERGDDETLEVLIANDTAALSRWASETVVERAGANAALQAVAVNRPSLPLDLLNQMYFVVEERLRQRIMARNASADPKALEAALSATRSLMVARDAEPLVDLEAAEAEIGKAAERGRLNAPMLIGHLRAGQRTHYIVGMARLAELDVATMRRIADRRDLDALAIVCKAADLDRSMFLTLVVLTLESRDAMARAPAYGKMYQELPRDAALRTLRFWRVRCEGEEAIAA